MSEPLTGIRVVRVGKISPVFSTADSRHSDSYAPPRLVGPFRGRLAEQSHPNGEIQICVKE